MWNNFKSNHKTNKSIIINNIKIYGLIKFLILIATSFIIGNCFLFTYSNFFIIPFLSIIMYRPKREFYSSIIFILLGIITNYYKITVGFTFTSIVINNSILIKYFTALMLLALLKSYIEYSQIKIKQNKLSYISSLISLVSSLMLLIYYNFSLYHIMLATVEVFLCFILTYILQDGINITTLNKIKKSKQYSEKELFSLIIVLFILLISLDTFYILNISMSEIVLLSFLFMVGYIYISSVSFFVSYCVTFLYGIFLQDVSLGYISLLAITISLVAFAPKKNKYIYSVLYLIVYVMLYNFSSNVYSYEITFINTYIAMIFAIFLFLIIDLKIFNSIVIKYPNYNVVENLNYRSVDKMRRQLKYDFKEIFNPYKNVINNINNKLDLYNKSYLEDKEKAESLKSLLSIEQKVNEETFDKIYKSISLDYNNFLYEEDKIYQSLFKKNFDIKNVLIKKLNSTIEITLFIKDFVDSYRYLSKIYNILDNVLNKKFVINNTFYSSKENCYIINFKEKTKFYLQIENVSVGKDNSNISGDNYTKINKEDNKSLIGISDGMGSGYDANISSSATLDLLDDLSLTNTSIKNMVNIINNIGVLNGDGETFTTLDLLEVDLQNGVGKSIKFGACPTYFVRNNRVRKINTNSLPLGVLSNIEYEEKEFQFKENDIIIMMSDGIYEANPSPLEKDMWLIEYLEKNSNKRLKDLCGNILELAIKIGGEAVPKDDMLVLGIAIKSNI
ncbi:MAG: SpoIIE family protein phosphatase [Lachnospirales bacterium]